MNGAQSILRGLICAAVLLSACTRSNSLPLGRVEATVGTHTVVVTDCYRTSVPQAQRVTDGAGGPSYDRFTPCRDADIVIRDEALVVNGKSYGRLDQGDTVTVDHGKVLINEREAQEVGRFPPTLRE